MSGDWIKDSKDIFLVQSSNSFVQICYSEGDPSKPFGVLKNRLNYLLCVLREKSKVVFWAMWVPMGIPKRCPSKTKIRITFKSHV